MSKKNFFLASKNEKGPFAPLGEFTVERFLRQIGKKDVRPLNVPGVDVYQSDNYVEGGTDHGRYIFWITEDEARLYLPEDVLKKLKIKRKNRI